jgi:hypothetical protein
VADVRAYYIESTSDTIVQGRYFADVYPVTAAFARNAEWYASNEPVTYTTHRYVKYGLPRILGPGDVVHVGDFRGVPVFAEPSVGGDEVIYLPVQPRCEFQTYVRTGNK